MIFYLLRKMQSENVRPTKFLEHSRIALEKEHGIRFDPRTFKVQVYCFPKTIHNKRYDMFTSSVMFICTIHNGNTLRIDYQNLLKYNLSFITFQGKIERLNGENFSFYSDYFKIIISPPSGLNKYVKIVSLKLKNLPDQYILKFVTPFIETDEEVFEDVLDDIDYN